ncbi:MAG: A24 family peptidase [Pararobbsia sp.]
MVGLGAALACVSLVLARDIWIATPFQSLLGVTLAFIVFLPLYAFGAMGAADVKVFGVLGLWLGVNTPRSNLAVGKCGCGCACHLCDHHDEIPTFHNLGRTLVIGSNDQIRGAPLCGFPGLGGMGRGGKRHASQLSIF